MRSVLFWLYLIWYINRASLFFLHLRHLVTTTSWVPASARVSCLRKIQIHCELQPWHTDAVQKWASGISRSSLHKHVRRPYGSLVSSKSIACFVKIELFVGIIFMVDEHSSQFRCAIQCGCFFRTRFLHSQEVDITGLVTLIGLLYKLHQ